MAGFLGCGRGGRGACRERAGLTPGRLVQPADLPPSTVPVSAPVIRTMGIFRQFLSNGTGLVMPDLSGFVVLEGLWAWQARLSAFAVVKEIGVAIFSRKDFVSGSSYLQG